MPPLAGRLLVVGGWLLVGVLFENWTVDASILLCLIRIVLCAVCVSFFSLRVGRSGCVWCVVVCGVEVCNEFLAHGMAVAGWCD